MQQVYVCKQCKMSVHTGSIKSIYTECFSDKTAVRGPETVVVNPEVSRTLNVNLPHKFVPSKNPRVSCSHCGKSFNFLSKPHLSCTACNNHYHTKCSPLVPNHCGINPEIFKSFIDIPKQQVNSKGATAAVLPKTTNTVDKHSNDAPDANGVKEKARDLPDKDDQFLDSYEPLPRNDNNTKLDKEASVIDDDEIYGVPFLCESVISFEKKVFWIINLTDFYIPFF